MYVADYPNVWIISVMQTLIKSKPSPIMPDILVFKSKKGWILFLSWYDLLIKIKGRS